MYFLQLLQAYSASRRTGCLLLLSLLVACGKPVPVELTEVVIQPAEQSYFPVYGEYIAMAMPSLDVEVRARVDGFVEHVDFKEGSLVKQGDPLYRIDARPYEAKVKRLTALLNSAKASLAKAGRDVKRLRPLFEEDAASQLDLDNALSAQETAAADVQAKQAELQEAELELSYTKVSSPIAGLVGASQVDVGALVGSGGQSLLTTVKQVDPMFIEFHMSTLDYLDAQRRKNSYEEKRKADAEGKAVEGFVRITLADDTDYRYWGDVSFTDPQVNPETGTFAVRAVVPNPDRELLPGQFTRARLELETIPDAVVVDETSIRIEQGGSYVMVVMPDKTVERRFIVPGPQREGRVVISSGLDAGEQVITEGMHRVQHGQRVVALNQQQYKERLEAEEKARLEEQAAPSDGES
ncbi:efflux RND transporter periplasmic adaptor subunit [Oceanicoccus sagamiensis]|nr:efflux RND transporter periplasmic adaptor subunit [Oceanicoccus sagamiensis]